MNVGLKDKINNRIIEIDVLRGICIFLMIFDHFIYDVFALMPYIFDFPRKSGLSYDIYTLTLKYWDWSVREILHYIICFFFLAITGICCSFSKSNFKRGVKLFIVSLILTLFTLITGLIISDVDTTIVFGILHAISLTLIIIGVLEKYIPHKSFYLLMGITMTTLGIIFQVGVKYVSLTEGNVFLTIIESIIGISACGSDHFPILLNGGQIFIGVYLGKTLYSNRKSLFKNAQYKNNIITFTGRNSLIMYFSHQIIIPIILIIILLICGFKLSI